MYRVEYIYNLEPPQWCKPQSLSECPESLRVSVTLCDNLAHARAKAFFLMEIIVEQCGRWFQVFDDVFLTILQLY